MTRPYYLTDWFVCPPEQALGEYKSQAELKIILPVKRRYHFYLSNVVCIMGCLSLSGFTVFGIGTDDLGSRSQVSLTLLLTAVAYKFVILDLLPKVSYSTYLDLYINFSFFFLFMLNVLNVIVAVTPQNESRTDSALCKMHPQTAHRNINSGDHSDSVICTDQESVDSVCLVLLLVAWVMWHVGYTVFVVRTLRRSELVPVKVVGRTEQGGGGEGRAVRSQTEKKKRQQGVSSRRDVGLQQRGSAVQMASMRHGGPDVSPDMAAI